MKNLNLNFSVGLQIALLLGTPLAMAKTDVKASMQQLKTNEQNAKANKKQYDENDSIASKNIVEVTAAIKQLREQKGKLVGNSQNLEKNRAILDKMKQKLQEFSSDESTQLKKEAGEIASLKATLEKLEQNKKQRLDNIETYQQKIADVEKERANWVEQNKAFSQIQKELDTKESKALTEREKWIEKRKGYREESTKWEKESELAEQTRVKMEN